MLVPGFGWKGEGTCNYGVAIPPPTLVDASDLPEEARLHTSSSVLQGEDPSWAEGEIPPPILATSYEVEMWMQESFRKLTNLSTKSPPEVGESVLWRGVKTGKRGQPSTKCEFFNGKVRGIHVDEDGDLHLHID